MSYNRRYFKEYSKRNRAAISARQKKWREENREHVRESKQNWRQRLKLEVLSHYSKGKLRCACCGTEGTVFLTLDHIKGGGNRHRKEVGGSMMYKYLIRVGYPLGYQVLCWNCNAAKHILGKCPHTSVTRIKS